MSAADPDLVAGWVAAELEQEHPELRLWSVGHPATAWRSPRAVRERMHGLSNRFRGAQAIVMRQEPIPFAYRVFYRHIGLDPDATRTPVEAVAVRRLIEGGYTSHNLLDDALLIALVETGVPVWALDADTLDGPLGIRAGLAREELGRGDAQAQLPEGRLVVADAAGPVAVLFGEVARAHAAGRSTRALELFALQVAGVPTIHVEEALWTCVEVLRAGV